MLIALPAAERTAILNELDDEDAKALLFDWEQWARPAQLPPSGHWLIWVMLAGRGYGKTRVGAEWTRAQVRDFEYVNLIGKSTDDVRDVMIQGESGILAVCPPEERPVYVEQRRLLRWPNGAKSLCFSAEEPEQLRGPQHQRLWGDELGKWKYPKETWDNAKLGLRLGPDPRALLTTTPRPIPVLRKLVEDPAVVITKGTTYENRLNLAAAFFAELITEYEGTRQGRQELEAELLLDEGLAYRLTDGTHVVPNMAIDNWWGRFEAMDYGTSSPTSWGCFAVDHDGNVIAFGLHYEPGFPSDTAPAILTKREQWWSRDSEGKLVRAICYAPADIRTRFTKDPKGNEVSAETEFNELGIVFARAQQDRRAGYIRIAERLKLDPEHTFPDWHPRAGEPGAPRFYVLDTEQMQPLIGAIRDAPLEDVDAPLSKLPNEAVDESWEHHEGHAHAMLRYALMSRPRTPAKPTKVITDQREARVAERLERLAKRDEEDLIDA